MTHLTKSAAALKLGGFDVPICPPVKILAARPEDSGTYVCTARSSGGSTEARVEVSVEGQPGTSVDEPRMVVVEGRTATLRCHVNGKATPGQTLPRQRRLSGFRPRTQSVIMGTFTNLLTIKTVSRFSSPGDHLVQAALSVAVETQSGEQQLGVAQRGPPRFWRIHLQSDQQRRQQPSHHQAGR